MIRITIYSVKTYNSFQLFWDDHSKENPNVHGFHDWQLVDFLRISDSDYSRIRNTEADELGFQPLKLTFANSLKKETKEYLIKGVPDSITEQFIEFSKDRYSRQLEKRFGNFTPNETHAFAEYDNWENFYSNWLERDGEQVFSKNVPLLFDHTPKVDYWLRKQSGETVLSYQRLLITTYFVSKRKFFSFFIKDVSDAEMERIKLLVQSRIGLNIDDFLSEGVRGKK